MPTIPIMPFIFVALLLLPVRMDSQQMKGLAFALWFVGGMVLAVRGMLFMSDPHNAPTQVLLALIVFASLLVGWSKGKFILSKTSQKNINRIDAFTEPKRPIQVYSVRSWIVIAVMVGISVSLNFLPISSLIRGAINLAIGTGLLISSLAYVRSFIASEKPPALPY